MRRAFTICCIIALVLVSLSCTPEATLSVSVNQIDNGIVIENTSNFDCIVFVASPEGAQRFELAVGENVTVRDILQPIEVAAFSL